MVDRLSFGRILKSYRQARDLTQEQLADKVSCSIETIKKIEASKLRPSRHLAALLADTLAIPPEEHAAFLTAARAELGADRRAVTSALVEPALVPLPTGTVTFLFTDIEGSTRRWELYPQAMQHVLARHDAILRNVIATHQGVVVKSTGDGFHAVFARAPDALTAAVAAQRALHAERWEKTGPLQVRMALHCGVTEERDSDYFGPALNRVARLLATGHGGQILLSLAIAELVREHLPADVELRDLGLHRLKDLGRPEHIFQVVTRDLPADFPPLHTLDMHRTNLPTQPTPLIGRATEVTAVRDRLGQAHVRLLTLTGPGGVGKTRLAVQVAAELLDDFAHGVFFVNLALIRDHNLVIATIAQTLQVKEMGGQPLFGCLKDYMRDKQALLLLDNFEQVIDAGPLIAELLAAAPGLKVLLTSRMRLRLSGEYGYAVPPLALPDRTQVQELKRLTQYEAVRLFIARAQAIKADFVVTNENAPAVAEICYQLDGLPLAIELVAARIKMFSPEALLRRLDSRLKLLTGGAGDLPARHRTIRNAIDWSYNLLGTGEQVLFRRLSVLVGGCTLEAVAAVCNPTGDLPLDVDDGVAALLDQNLLRQEEQPDGESRFTMLGTIREYGLERLGQSGEAETLRQRHARYYLAQVEQAESKLHGAEELMWFNWMEMEHDNLRAALAWSQTAGSGDVGLRLVGILWWFWETRGYRNEGCAWIEHALEVSSDAPVALRAKVLLASSRLASDAARAQDSLMLFRDLGDVQGIAWALNALGNAVYYSQGNAEQAMPLLQESLTLFRELGDTYGIAWALGSLGYVVHRHGDNERAMPLLEESLALARQLGDAHGIAWRLTFLAWIARDQGDYLRSQALSEEGLLLGRALGDRLGVAQVLDNLGHVVLHQGDPQRSIVFFGESLSLFQELGDKHSRARVLLRLGELARLRGDNVLAMTHCSEGLRLYREEGNTGGTAWALASLGYVTLQQGHYPQAETLFMESLALCRDLGITESFGDCLTALAGVAVAQGQLERAARLLGAAERMYTVSNTIQDPISRIDHDRIVTAARAQFGDVAFVGAVAEGRTMTLEQATAYAHSVASS